MNWLLTKLMRSFSSKSEKTIRRSSQPQGKVKSTFQRSLPPLWPLRISKKAQRILFSRELHPRLLCARLDQPVQWCRWEGVWLIGQEQVNFRSQLITQLPWSNQRAKRRLSLLKVLTLTKIPNLTTRPQLRSNLRRKALTWEVIQLAIGSILTSLLRILVPSHLVQWFNRKE